MRLYLRSQDRRPDPPPLPTDDRGTVLVGMVVWAVLWAAALVLRSRLAEAGHGWWIWTPPSALLLGVFGLWYIHRRTVRLRRGRRPDPGPPGQPGDEGDGAGQPGGAGRPD